MLHEREAERLLHVARASLEVRRRSQFFLWSQGQLHSLVPHEVMVCVHGDFARRALVVEHFASFPLPHQDSEGLRNTDSGLMIQAIRHWAEGGERPLTICSSDRDAVLYRRFESALLRHAFRNFAIHGVPMLEGTSGSFFAFASMPQPVSPRLEFMLEILTPYIHTAFVRMLANECDPAAEVEPADRIITVRETEILQWVRDGKSNQEIGQILNISPLTVKNHIQKMLKKLNVQNRAQAVAKGLSLKLIKNIGL